MGDFRGSTSLSWQSRLMKGVRSLILGGDASSASKDVAKIVGETIYRYIP